MKLRSWRTVLVLVACPFACAGSLKPKLDAGYTLEATDYPFPSGLRVIFQRDPSQASVVVSSVIDAGSSADPAGKEGLAHLLEHLCFRATHGNGLTVREHMNRLGAGTFNASTHDDFTDYYSLGPKAALVPLLQIEAARLTNPLEGVTEEILATEREIVRNELRMRTENTLAYRLYELSKQRLFPEGHPYHRSGIGSHGSLDAITLADLRKFAKEHYVPAKATIVVSGDFEQAELGGLLNKVFSRDLVFAPGSTEQRITLRKPEPRVTGVSTPPPPADRTLLRVDGPVQRDTLVLAWSLPGAYRDDEPLIELTILTLNFALREKLGPEFGFRRKERIEALGCSPILARDASVALCTIQLAKGQDPEEIAKRALGGLKNLHRSWIGETYLFKDTKRDRQAELFRESASIWRAVPLAEYAHFRGRADLFSGSMDRWEKITPKQSHDLAEQYLTAERAVQVLIKPYPDADRPRSTIAFDPDASWPGATLAAGGDVSWITEEALTRVTTTPDMSSTKSLVLPNGLRAVIKRQAGAPFVRVGFYANGGKKTADPWGLPDFSFRISEAGNPERLAGKWVASAYGDGELLGIEAPSGNLKEAVDLLHERIKTTRAAFYPDGIDRVLHERKRVLKDFPPSAARSAERAFWKNLYPLHPIGRTTYDLEAIARIERKEVTGWIDAHYAPRNAILYVVGNVDLAEAEALVAKEWGGWRKRSAGEPTAGYPKPPAPPASRILVFDEPDATQTALMIGCHLSPFTGEGDAARDVFVEVLDTDLFTAIRERAGASYGVNVSATHASGGVHTLRVTTLVQNDKIKPALQTVLSRIKRMSDAGATGAEVSESKWRTAIGTHARNLSSADLMSTLVQLGRDGRTVDSLGGYAKRLAGVTAADLSAFMKPCTGHEVITAIGPKDAIKASLEALGIPLQVVDWHNQADEELAEDGE